MIEFHDFRWAMDELMAGRRVRRDAWEEGTYCYINQHHILMFHLKGDYAGRFGDGSRELVQKFDWQDIRTRDWRAA